MVKENNWEEVEHYKMSCNAKNFELFKFFEINGIPFCIICDNKGIVKFFGHPMNYALEEEFNKMMNSN